MKQIYFLILCLSLSSELRGQAHIDFYSLVKNIINNQVSDSISDQMKTKGCVVIVLNNEVVRKFKDTPRIDQVCILTEEEIFLENPTLYIEFEKVSIKRSKSTLSLRIVEHNPFKRKYIKTLILSYKKINNEWNKI